MGRRIENNDFCMFYFLCTTQEITTFFIRNFRHIKQSFFLLNSNHYSSRRDLLQFQRFYRLPVGSIFAVTSNAAFQAAISTKQDNRFFRFYYTRKHCGQNSDYLEQFHRLHLLAADYIKGGLLWRNKHYF